MKWKRGEEMTIRFTLNGRKVSVNAPGAARLLDVLRERMRLTGSKEGCGEGECGACSVLLNGRVVNSCLVAAAQVEGQEVVTVEGIALNGRMRPVQQAFIETGAVQCGFCIPGMIVSAQALLNRRRRPTREEIKAALGGNLCRCTGYGKIVEAVEKACRN